MEKSNSQVEEAVSYCGWRMKASLARQLQEQRLAREAAGIHTVMENTAYGSKPAAQGGKAKVVKEEDLTTKLFSILTSDGYSAPRVELTAEASEQLWSVIEGSADWRPLPAKVKAEDERYRQEQQQAKAKDEGLLEAFCKAFSGDLVEASGSDPAVLDKLYNLLQWG